MKKDFREAGSLKEGIGIDYSNYHILRGLHSVRPQLLIRSAVKLEGLATIPSTHQRPRRLGQHLEFCFKL